MKMRCVSALLVVVLVSYGACETPTNATEGACDVVETTAICGEVFKWPEDLRIKNVVVRSTLLKRIEKHDLAKYEHLETVDISNSGLHHIDPDAFSSNEKLTELNLSGNRNLQFPTEHPFIVSKSLTSLNLSHIEIEDLPENVFNALSNLQVIDLTSTNITNFSSLSNLEYLQTLIISEDLNLNKTSLCHETHLKQITEIENDKRTTFNCPETTNEDKHTTEPATTNLPIVSQNTIKEEEQKSEERKEEEQKEVKPAAESETEPPKTETITEETKSIPEKEKPENFIELKLVKPEIKNSTDTPETSKSEEKSKDTAETKGENEDKLNLESKTETGATEKPTEKVTEKATENATEKATEKPTEKITEKATEKATETAETENLTTDKVIDSLIQFENISPQPPKEEKTHEDIEKDEGQDKAQVKAVMPQPTTSESNGVNIVLGIILCVMIVGGVGFGYKYWKNRRGGYSNANTEDVEEGKELQNMMSHRATNGEPDQN